MVAARPTWRQATNLLYIYSARAMDALSVDVERERYARSLARDLGSLVRQLRRMPEVQKVVLFGSYAAGRRDLLTDLDLLVIMQSPLDFVTRCASLTRRLRASVALDVLVYTPEEIAAMEERPFLRHVFRTGRVVYEKRSA